MPRRADITDRRIIPLGIVLAVVAASVAASFLLVPSPEKLRAWLFKDRVGGEILALIEAGTFGDKQEARSQFYRMNAEQLTFISKLSRLTPRERLRLIFSADHTDDYDVFVHYFVIAAVQYVDVIKPEEAFAFAAPMADRIPEQFRVQLFRLLARNALAMNNPETAAHILRQACNTDSADWQTISALVDAERWTNRPGEAHKALKEWLDRHSKELDPQVHDQANDILFSLALEANVPAQALSACMRDLRKLGPAEAIPESLMEQSFKASEYSGETRELLPWIERHLKSFAEEALDWPELMQRHRAGTALSSDYRLWTRRAAQVADWNAIADRGAHHHLRLVAAGEIDSLDRYLSLSSYLGLGEETARLLMQLGPVPGHDDLQLKLARLLASNGDAQLAMKHYDEWIAAHPDDRDARWEHACLEEAITLSPNAVSSFDKLLHDYPEDGRAVKRAVGLLQSHGQHLESLRRLDALSDDDFDPDTLEDYLLLAESLDEATSLVRALRLKITRTAQPRPHDWLRLAEVTRTAADADAALAILREAIEHLPDISMLRTQMAAMLLQEGRHDEAVTAALHPAAWVDTEARLTALSASIYCGRAADVLTALGDDFQVEGQAYNTILDLAVAHRQTGHIERSRELFARVPEVPERYYHLAQAHLLAGDFLQAVRLAQLNLNEKPFPDAPDWMLMGDIRHKQGLRTEAQQAYTHAVEAVAKRQERRTAAIKAERESGSQ